MTDRSNILYLFDRPKEPLFVAKGNDNVSFNVPSEYLNCIEVVGTHMMVPLPNIIDIGIKENTCDTNLDNIKIDRYKPLVSDIHTRFPGDKEISIKKLNNIPDLSLPLSLSRNASFSLFNPLHSKMASRLIEVLMATKSFDDLMSLAVYCRDRVNSYMFIYALSVVMLHKPETRNLPLPSHVEMFPSLYMGPNVFSRAREEAEVVPANSRVPIEIPQDFTASDLDPEHKLSYFREDIGLNLHHWHWHLVYPFEGPINVVNKDRRGELFFYMHQQIIARYNMERLSNGMNRVERLTHWNDPITEAYFPKLDNILSNGVWPSRFANSRLSNINREADQISFDVEDLERWRDRLFKAIHSGFIVNTSGQQVPLTEHGGIDILGNLVEASILSQNPNLYGSLHNQGHNAISYIHDPDNRYLEKFGVMGDSATAMRDPVFYRWHAYIDDIFQEFKSTIPSYPVQNLTFENVRVQSVEVTATGIPRNEFATFWQKSNVELSRGLDFMPRGSVLARFTHLQHAPFNYKIVIENSGNQRTGRVRIFMAPKLDERGSPILFRDQRKLFVELDKFSVSLTRGRNEITRSSLQSSVTIPHEITYRNLDSNRPADNTAESAAFNFCGCGWPQNLLIPKGSADGLQCQLFVMVSDGAIDQVENAQAADQTCDDASSYCGLRNARYPDSRSMGYPFDRVPRNGVVTLQQFLTPNMIVQDVRIRFTNRTVSSFTNNTNPANQTNKPPKGGNRPRQ